MRHEEIAGIQPARRDHAETAIPTPALMRRAEAQRTTTHEGFLLAVREIVVGRLNDDDDRRRLLSVKIGYGSGDATAYGVCHFGAWSGSVEFIDIVACTEESPLQLAATLIHELAHVKAGWAAGHGTGWKADARLLGLARPVAVGWDGQQDNFDPEILRAVLALGTPEDGHPTFKTNGAGKTRVDRPCTGGIGTRGGSSRGPGTGSRLRLFMCACAPPVKVRVAHDEFHAQCTLCNAMFKRTITTAKGKSQ